MQKRMALQRQSKEVRYKIKSPSVVILAGPTQSGKTTLISRLIRHSSYWSEVVPKEIIYCYSVWQEKFNALQDIVTFNKGLISLEDDIPNDGEHRWLILDDLMEEVTKSSTQKTFTFYSHHKNVTVFFLIQNFFEKNIRTITLNAHYIAFFKNPRDRSQILTLGQKVFPNQKERVCSAYRDAAKAAYSHLWFDLTQDADDDLRLLGNYGSDPKLPIVVY